MYSKNLKDLALRYEGKPTGNIRRWWKDLTAQLETETAFLPLTSTITQRLYHVRNDLFEIPKCQNCGINECKWFNCYKPARYARFCSNECVNKSEKVKEKRKNTMLNEYGSETPFGSKQIQEKSKETRIKKYNDPFYSNKEQAKITNIERYGVENALSAPKVREKITNTLIEKYNATNPFQINEIKFKIRQTNIKRFGTEFYVQSEDFKNKSDKSRDLLYEIHSSKFKTAFSRKAITWLETIMTEQNIFIRHAQNIGEFKIPGLKIYVDGFCEQNNTVYEFHGDAFHGNPKKYSPETKCHPFNKEITAEQLYSRTLNREQIIKDAGYNIITMWELDWDL